MKFYIVSLIALLIIIASTYSQNDYRRLPLAMKPEKSLTPEEKQFLGRLHLQLVRGKQLPPEVLKMDVIRDRILNSDGFELINVSQAPAGQHETSIAINPKNPLNMIATSNDSRYLQAPPWGYRMVAFYTTDGGKTWAETTTPYNQNLYISMPSDPWKMTIFDPGVTFDTKGNAYYSYGFTQTVETGRDDNGVFVSKSTDGGKTWSEPIPVALAIGFYPNPFHDRYMITADINEESPYKDRLYVTWKRFIVNPACLISYSVDGGETWTQARALPGSEKPRTQSATPTVGPNGILYVVWEDKDEMTWTTSAMVQISTNGGVNWLANPKVAQKVITIGRDFKGRVVLPDKQNIRVGSDPVIAVDNSNGPRRGWVYVVQAGKDEQGRTALYLARSTDNGNTWRGNQRIDDNNLGNDIFFPSITVDRKTGAVCIFYYSSQNDPGNKGVDGYIAFSEDGVNFTNIRLTPQTWYIDRLNKVLPQGEENNIYWGDYTSIASHDGKFYPLFWMPMPITGDANSLELFTAELSPRPRMPQNLNAESSWENPDKIKLTWKDPDKTLLGTTLNDFKIIIKRDGKEIAQVDAGVQTYTDTGLEDGKKYLYSIRARNQYGESMETSVSAYAGSALKPLPPTDLIAKPDKNGILIQWRNPYKHIDGSPFFDFSHIAVYVDSQFVKNIDKGIAAGELSSAVIELTTEKFYKVFLKAVGKRGDIETESESSNEFFSYAGAPIDNFADNFDNPDKRIPHHIIGTWDITDKKAKSEPYSFTDTPEGNYAPGETLVLFAPTVIKAGKTTLSFDHIALIDIGAGDNGVIAISNDFGKTWKDLRWVDRNTSPNFKGDISQADWDYLGISLEDFVGDTVYLRFSVFANFFKHDDGWYIDNLEIGDKPVSVENTMVYNALLKLEAIPNPANEIISLNVSIPIRDRYSINIYDLLGNRLIKVQDKVFEAGEYKYTLDVRNLSQGIYYCVINNGSYMKTIPLIIER